VKKNRKVIIAAWDEELTTACRRLSDMDVEFAPAGGLGTLNGAAVASSAMVVQIDLRHDNALDELGALARAMPDRKIIAAARGADGDDVRRLFRAGAADVLTSPFTLEAVKGALCEVFEMNAQASRARGNVISVIKAGGGAGATTVALNLAQLLARGDTRRKQSPRSTALLDLDLQFGDTDVALNLQPRSTVLDILGAENRLDGRFLQSVLTEHRQGLKVLAPAPSLLPLDALSSAFAVDILDQSARLHELTFVDLPGAWADWTPAVLKRSDLIVLVATTTVSSVLRTRRTLTALRTAQVKTPIFFMLNKLGGMVDAFEKPQRVGRTLDVTVDATAAFDPSAAKAADRGELVVEAFANSRVSRDLRGAAGKIQQRLAEARAPARPQLAGEAA
jgi:pilus assembly protein CpaE